MSTPQSQILSLLTRQDSCSIPQIADALGVSIGTATKYVGALLEAKVLEDLGKAQSVSGRRPHRYSLRADAGWFLGVDVNDRYINAGLMDFQGNMHGQRIFEDFILDSKGAFVRLSDILREIVSLARENGLRIKGTCLAVPGRIDDRTGDSYTWFYEPGKALARRLQEQMGIPTSLFNDTRAMTVGEYIKGAGAGTQNMLMINVNWGLGMGIVMDGQVYSGKSGYAGEFGHVYGFDNQIICRCGKRGCNETEISGQALQRNLVERIRAGESSILSQRVLESDKPLMLSEIMDAVAREDVLCIDVIERIGILLGEKTSGLINLFNPELVVVGGELAMTGDYLLDPMRMAVNKHAIHLVSRDTRICRSALGMDAGIVGACLVARNNLIENRIV
ncbi:MAG: ROK family transcriptional regulator [Bacteroidales bacterium]|nr:ROK family transcriptional regulator [Bacteroidales bacterium]